MGDEPKSRSARRSWRTLFPSSDDAPTPPSSPPLKLMKLSQSQSASNSTDLLPSPQLNNKSRAEEMGVGKPSQPLRRGDDPASGIANSSLANDGVQEEEEKASANDDVQEEEKEKSSANDGDQEEEKDDEASASDGVQEDENEMASASDGDQEEEDEASANDGVQEEEKALKADLSASGPESTRPDVAAGEKMKSRPTRSKGKGSVARVWSVEDELRILECLAAFVKDHGAPPPRSQLLGVVLGHTVDKKEFTLVEIYEKVRRLRDRYYNMRPTAATGAPPRGDAEDLQKYELSEKVWGSSLLLPKRETKENGSDQAPETHARREFEELQRMYPHLSLVVEQVAAAGRGYLKRAFEFIDDRKAGELDAKVKKQRISEMKIERDRMRVRSQVLSTLVEYMA